MIGFRASPGPRPSASHPASDSGKTPHLTPAASLHHEEGNEEKKKNGPTEAVTMDSRARRLQGLVQGPTGFAYSTSSPKLTTPLVNPSDDRVKVAGKSYMLEKLPALPEDKRGSASTAVPNLLKIDEITSSQLIDDYIVSVYRCLLYTVRVSPFASIIPISDPTDHPVPPPPLEDFCGVARAMTLLRVRALWSYPKPGHSNTHGLHVDPLMRDTMYNHHRYLAGKGKTKLAKGERLTDTYPIAELLVAKNDVGKTSRKHESNLLNNLNMLLGILQALYTALVSKISDGEITRENLFQRLEVPHTETLDQLVNDYLKESSVPEAWERWATMMRAHPQLPNRPNERKGGSNYPENIMYRAQITVAAMVKVGDKDDLTHPTGLFQSGSASASRLIISLVRHPMIANYRSEQENGAKEAERDTKLRTSRLRTSTSYSAMEAGEHETFSNKGKAESEGDRKGVKRTKVAADTKTSTKGRGSGNDLLVAASSFAQRLVQFTSPPQSSSHIPMSSEGNIDPITSSPLPNDGKSTCQALDGKTCDQEVGMTESKTVSERHMKQTSAASMTEGRVTQANEVHNERVPQQNPHRHDSYEHEDGYLLDQHLQQQLYSHQYMYYQLQRDYQQDFQQLRSAPNDRMSEHLRYQVWLPPVFFQEDHPYPDQSHTHCPNPPIDVHTHIQHRTNRHDGYPHVLPSFEQTLPAQHPDTLQPSNPLEENLSPRRHRVRIRSDASIDEPAIKRHCPNGR